MVTACASMTDKSHNLSIMGITSNWQWPQEKPEAWIKSDLSCLVDEMGTEPYGELDKVRTYRLGYASGTTDISKTIEWLVGQIAAIHIQVKQTTLLKSYLFRFPDLIGMIIPLCNRAKHYFGEQARLTLELYCDPEISDDYLTLYIRYDSYPENMLDRIEDFSNKCADILYGKKGGLLITTDFSKAARDE